ncbi:zinc ABC transporter substrate-binding protein [Lysinibacillus capsici]|uniref:metal ABC transporter solute-binding protein, Zn/Mn family n=1 Tax=Lysinibacillus TaxID=400634 RepID=UPI0006535544|nr:MULTISPECIES: zinc ABC transporter substrate-binding protein [Lysinibacillus]KMN40148.1 manganese transporter [Lysinibacillus sp. LK3]MCT1540611.1 zinc ABC transporter substrate-binding protein [Lysinibacillus capsici]MCT1571849.1 zinc ABC transporter substrate-binding protein [Lysinibacillus capsici]MCT1648993.1 zinc ABC transporter substrate-binding protein [Lysinibacillus capsici]MCT1727279.1 zinc ABC transporter substrate-binding protein [Lysinibacillus capsici]
MKQWLGVVVLSLSFLLFGCSAETEGEKEGIVVATTGQIADAIKEISGDHLQVSALMGPGVDPHLYKATQSDLSKLDKAEVIFYNGLHLEGQMLDIFEQMAKDKTVLAVGETLDEKQLLASDTDAMLHDPHIWFDVELWKGVVKAISTQLQEEYPEFKEDFQTNEAAYLKKLDDLQSYAEKRVNEIPQQQRILVTAHDAFNYFGRSQGFEVRGLQGLSTDSEYGVKDVQEMVDFLVENKIKALFIESSVSDKAMKAVIEGAKEKGHDIVIGGELFSDAMGAEGTTEGTYIGMYQHNIDTIVDALK